MLLLIVAILFGCFYYVALSLSLAEEKLPYFTFFFVTHFLLCCIVLSLPRAGSFSCAVAAVAAASLFRLFRFAFNSFGAKRKSAKL